MIGRRTLAVLLFLLAALSMGVEAAQPVSPTAVALKLSDLPAGYRQTSAKLISNKQAAKESHVSLATLNQKGRIAAYDVSFARATASAKPSGIIDLDDSAVSFKTVSGARWGYTFAQRAAVKAFRPKKNYRVLAPGGLGNQRAAFSYDQSSSGYVFTAVIILFRRGRYGTTLIGIGLKGTFNSAQVFSYARIIDGRMKRAG